MPTILVVDDEPAVRHVVRTTLETRDYTVQLAEDGNSALDKAQRERPDLIVLDWGLPDMSGLEVCRRLRTNPNTAYIPIIFLTALDELDRKIAGLDAGADDYMTKPFEPQELLARVNRRLRTAAERGQLSPLTGLPGNILIEQAIGARLARPQEPFALLYFDLNEFKAYNDFFGFSWGDELLKALAAVIRRAVAEQGGPNTFLGHVGGDDFVAICRPEYVVPVCEQAIRDFEREAIRMCAAAGSPNGFVGKDRAGQLRRFGPATLAIGVITSEQRSFGSYLEIGQVAAQVKSAAKRQPGSSYVIDRRRASGTEFSSAE